MQLSKATGIAGEDIQLDRCVRLIGQKITHN